MDGLVLSIERVATNIDDTTMADNEGNMPVDQPIFKDGENVLTNLPIKKDGRGYKKEALLPRFQIRQEPMCAIMSRMEFFIRSIRRGYI